MHAFRNLDGLLEHLLLFAKPVHVGRQPLRIKRLLDNVECSAIHPLRQKQITIHRTVEPGLDEVWGDEELLKRAVLNVVMNAIHASSHGGHIEIACQRVALAESAQRSSQAGWGVQLVIRDHGCGISSDDVQKIFDPFFSTRKGGTGLGLPIVKHILNAHHGLINVQSEHGRGTTVRLVLPQ